MFFLNTKIPFVIAHRGISAYAPENTMPAIQAVNQSKAAWLECDVLLSKKSETEFPKVFLLHDDDLNRTTSGQGLADQRTWSELSALDAGSWFHPKFKDAKIPLLSEVLMYLSQTELSFNIELKAYHHREAEFAKAVCDTVGQSGWDINSPRLLFSSFYVPVLYAFRACAPKANIAFLIHDFQDVDHWQERYRELNCCSLNINHELLTEDVVKMILDQGIQYILAYTVDDPLRAKELFSWGVSAVFSNDPDGVC